MKQVIFAALVAATTFPIMKAELLSSESLDGAALGCITAGPVGGLCQF